MTVRTAERGLRADAVRNRDRVLEAAREVFAAHGMEAGVPEIAARAGVGKATVYRSFPTKEHLVCAIAGESMSWLADLAEAAADAADPWAGFTGLLHAAAERQAHDRAFTTALAYVSGLPELTEIQERAYAALERLMTRAKASGTMRRDATTADVRLLWGGAGRLLAADGVEDPARWHRAADLAACALRA